MRTTKNKIHSKPTSECMIDCVRCIVRLFLKPTPHFRQYFVSRYCDTNLSCNGLSHVLSERSQCDKASMLTTTRFTRGSGHGRQFYVGAARPPGVYVPSQGLRHNFAHPPDAIVSVSLVARPPINFVPDLDCLTCQWRRRLSADDADVSVVTILQHRVHTPLARTAIPI